MKNNFIDFYLKGRVSLEEIDDWIDDWHESDLNEELHEYLGMTLHEYELFMYSPDILPLIILSYKEE